MKKANQLLHCGVCLFIFRFLIHALYFTGFGLNDRHHTPELVRSIGAFFRSTTPGGVYLMAGVPGHWRTSTSDADRNPEFVPMWTDVFDAISPWTVGRYGNEEDADRWGEERVKPDADYLKKLGEETGKKVDYIPVVLPGGSVSVVVSFRCLSSIPTTHFYRAITSPKGNGGETTLNGMVVSFYGSRYTTHAVQVCAPSMARCGTSMSSDCCISCLVDSFQI